MFPVRMGLIAGLAWIAATPAICAAGDSDGPDAAYQQFVQAEERGDAATAWSLLSSGTQADLTHQAQQVAAFRHQPAPADGRELAFGEMLMAPRKIEKIEVGSQSGDQATLVVTDDKGGQEHIDAVRESGHWRIDLTPQLKQAGKS